MSMDLLTRSITHSLYITQTIVFQITVLQKDLSSSLVGMLTTLIEDFLLEKLKGILLI